MPYNEITCDYKIQKSKDNNDILFINGKCIHSQISPSKDADTLIYQGKNLIIVFGIGMAYHINNLIRNNTGSYFILFEPYKQIKTLSQQHIDAEFLKKYSNKILIIDEADQNVIYNFIGSNNLLANTKIITYSNAGYKSLLPELEKFFFNSVKNIFQTYIQNLMTENSFTPLWTKNFFYNIRQTAIKPILSINKTDTGSNIAVIAAAGPTLIDELEIIKKNRSNITLYCVDTAIKPLLKYGIYPDFAVSLDGQYYTMLDYIKNMPQNITILYDVISYPAIPEINKNIYFTVTNNLMHNTALKFFFDRFNIKINGIDTGGTVSDYALNIAIASGFKNIFFAGLDLSYPQLLTHCIDTPFYEYMLINSNYYNTIFSQNAAILSGKNLLLKNSKNDGKQVFTDFILNNYAAYFEKILSSHEDINFFYSQNNGLKIQNIKTIDLNDLIISADSSNISPDILLNSADKILFEKKDLLAFYSSLLKDLHHETLTITNIFEKIDFNLQSDENLNILKNYYEKLIFDYPFLTKFSIMTQLILEKKSIDSNDVLWYKHILHKILQSLFYIIRILQKCSNF